MAKLKYLALIPLVYVAITRLLHVFYFGGTFCDSRVRLDGKTVIVTGANTGIGKATALDMASRGARVILACRSEKRAMPVVREIISQTKNEKVLFMQLDLGSFSSVNAFSQKFLAKEERLDILINNAGMIGPEKPEKNENGIELTFAVNHLGPFLLTKNLLDLLIKTGPGTRIINVSSMGHHLANPVAFENLEDLLEDGVKGATTEYLVNLDSPAPNFFFDHILSKSALRSMIDDMIKNHAMQRYMNSKLANVLFTKELAKRVKSKGVATYSLHPGVIKTDIGIDRQTNQYIEGIGSVMFSLPDFLNPFIFLFKTLEGGAQTTICCAVSDKLGLNESGGYFSDCQLVPVKRPEMNDEFLVRFYDWSDKVIQNALKSEF